MSAGEVFWGILTGLSINTQPGKTEDFTATFIHGGRGDPVTTVKLLVKILVKNTGVSYSYLVFKSIYFL